VKENNLYFQGLVHSCWNRHHVTKSSEGCGSNTPLCITTTYQWCES